MAHVNTSKNLEFIIGEEFVPVIESLDRFPQSLFKDVYHSAFRLIDDFLNIRENDATNNIFAFVGERGSGKSSCMQSVAMMLASSELDIKKAFGNEFSKVLECEFEKMDTIDPGMFEANNNILQLVIGKLFKAFKDSVDNVNNQQVQKDDYQQRKRALVDIFEKIYGNIKVLTDKDKHHSNESLDALLDLSASYDLRENIKELFTKYLEFNNKKNGVLVLQIDDIDLQTEYAYNMVEQIRKYMMHSNIIILMAVRISQLEDVITRRYVNEFQLLLDKKYMNQEAPTEMSERYLSKLIPHERRLFLPDMEVNFNTPVRIFSSQDSYDQYVKGRELDSNKYQEFRTIREAILKLIYSKTRFLFYNSKENTSYIVPRNLREMRSIIRLLYNMKDYRTIGDDINENERPKYNKELFQKYFLETWLKNNLDNKGIELVKNIWHADAIIINKLIVDSFKDKLKGMDNKGGVEFKAIDDIISASNKVYDISAGDTLGLLDTLNMHLVEPKDQKLIFAIKSVYSMLLYKYYDQHTDNSIDPILKRDILEGESNYIKIVAGSFINSRFYNFMPYSKKSGSRTSIEVRAQLVAKGFDDLYKQYYLNDEHNPSSIPTADNNPAEYNKFKAKLNVLEFLILNFEARGQVNKVNMRSLGNPSYIYSVTKSTTAFQFDVFGYAYNLINIEDTYKKYSAWFGTSKEGELLNFVSKQKDSLYSRIKECEKKRSSYKSMVCFRNTEIISAFISNIINNRLEGTTDNIKIYSDLYKHLGEFSINDYDNQPINFEFIGEIGKALSEISQDKTPEAYDIFNKVLFPAQTLNTSIKINTASRNATSTILIKLKAKNESADIDDMFNRIFTETAYEHLEVKRLLAEIKAQYDSELDTQN